MQRIMPNYHPRRGAFLGVCITIFPIVVALFLVALTREDIALRETQRREQRLQARLLAESALVLAQATGQAQAGQPLSGELEGAGTYRLEAAAENPAPETLASLRDARLLLSAVGEVRGHNRQVTAELKVRARAMQPLSLTYSMDQIEPWVNEDTPPPPPPVPLTPAEVRLYLRTGQLPPGKIRPRYVPPAGRFGPFGPPGGFPPPGFAQPGYYPPGYVPPPDRELNESKSSTLQSDDSTSSGSAVASLVRLFSKLF